MTSYTNLHRIQYKVVHRTHIIQYKKYKMGLRDTDNCAQCTMGVTDTYLHALQECSPVQAFWNTVPQKLRHSELQNPLFPILLFTWYHHNYYNTTQTEQSVDISITKKIILQNWKSKISINVNHWSNSLILHISIPHTAASYDDDTPSFMETWASFINHFNIIFNQPPTSLT